MQAAWRKQCDLYYLSDKGDLSAILSKPGVNGDVLKMVARDQSLQSMRRHVGFRLVLVKCVDVEVDSGEPNTGWVELLGEKAF